MSQNEGTATPPDNKQGARSPTFPPEPPSHLPDPLPTLSTLQTMAEGRASGQALSNGHNSPDPSPAPDPNSNAEPGPIANGTSHDAHGARDEDHEDPVPMDAQLGNPRDALEPQDWEDLEERFAARMKECRVKEEELGKEFAEWVEVCGGHGSEF